ncbi:response regulator [Acinetobacter baumannii]
MDVQMPICDGLEATRAIRQSEQNEGRPRLPIYALTANALSDDRDECLAAGMDGFLAKPIPLPALQALLSRVQVTS